MVGCLGRTFSKYLALSLRGWIIYSITVNNLIEDDGGVDWNMEVISSIFCEEEARLIMCIPLSIFKPSDTLIWNVYIDVRLATDGV